MNQNITHEFIAQVGHPATISAMTEALSTTSTLEDFQSLKNDMTLAKSLGGNEHKEAYRELGQRYEMRVQEVHGKDF